MLVKIKVGGIHSGIYQLLIVIVPLMFSLVTGSCFCAMLIGFENFAYSYEGITHLADCPGLSGGCSEMPPMRSVWLLRQASTMGETGSSYPAILADAVGEEKVVNSGTDAFFEHALGRGGRHYHNGGTRDNHSDSCG